MVEPNFEHLEPQDIREYEWLILHFLLEHNSGQNIGDIQKSSVVNGKMSEVLIQHIIYNVWHTQRGRDGFLTEDNGSRYVASNSGKFRFEQLEKRKKHTEFLDDVSRAAYSLNTVQRTFVILTFVIVACSFIVSIGGLAIQSKNLRLLENKEKLRLLDTLSTTLTPLQQQELYPSIHPDVGNAQTR